MDIESTSFTKCYQDACDEPIHLVLGNGFSIGASDKFRYKSLIDAAEFEERVSCLFKRINTNNFEEVLDQYQTAIDINHVYEIPSDALVQDQDKVRDALIKAINRVHPNRQSEVAKEKLIQSLEFIKKFNSVFTFNYDLHLYWVHMQEAAAFCDGFQKNQYGNCIFRANYLPGRIPIYYLHGALHLYEHKQNTYKRISNPGQKVIDVVRESMNKKHNPLFVTEGKAEYKKVRIAKNPYLTYCWKTLRGIKGALFIYGHSLSDKDHHLIEAIIENRGIKSVFIGTHDVKPSKTMKEAYEELKDHRTNLNIRFFQSRDACVWEPDRRGKTRE